MSETKAALDKGIEDGVTLKELSKLYCAHILSRHDNNKVHASRVLQVDRRTLQRWGIAKGEAGRPGVET